MSPKGESRVVGGLEKKGKFRVIAIGATLLLDEDWPIETVLNLSLCVTMVPKVTSIDSTY